MKNFLFKRAAKKTAKAGLRKEAKIIAGALLTIATHKIIQKAAKTYPALNFLRIREKA
jgi:hypothetical protein